MKRLILAIFAVTTWSCRSSVESGLGSVIGTYRLAAVNGAALPFHEASSFTVRGTVDLRKDGRYTLTQAESASTGAVTNISSVGHWALQENALALVDDTGPLQLAIVVIDTMRMSYRGHDNLYVRR